MKGLRQFFHVIVTAVICFFMGIKSKREEKRLAASAGHGVRKETRGMSGCSEGAEASVKNAVSGRSMENVHKWGWGGGSLGSYKVSRRVNGPGDRPRPVRGGKRAGAPLPRGFLWRGIEGSFARQILTETKLE